VRAQRWGYTDVVAARWLVGAGDFTNTDVQGHGEGEVLPKTIHCSQMLCWGRGLCNPGRRYVSV